MNTLRFALLAAALLATRAQAIVLYYSDSAAHQQAPPNGAPWQYVAHIGLPDGSGVYLGKRFILTANHVTHIDTIKLNGQMWQRDTSFAPRRIGTEDLKLIRIVGDPGLPRLPLIAATDNEFGRRCTVIGCGLGTGTAIPRQGWHWNSLWVKRWGYNITLPYTIPRPDGKRLATAFDHGAGADEMSLANADSGCGLFIRFSGLWKLAAIGIDVDIQSDSFFDRDLTKSGLQPTRSYYVRLRPLRTIINGIVNAAAP